MSQLHKCLHIGLICLALTSRADAQTAPVEVSAAPRLVRIAGAFTPANGLPAAPVEVATLAIYAEERGGSALWSETQNLVVDAAGRYTVLLGATQPDGLPVDLFPTGKARWLGVVFERPGEAEQPRVLLASVPYAVKASDADTLGGRPASAYQLADATAADAPAGSGSTTASAAATTAVAGGAIGDTLGTAGYIGKFINGTDVRNSVLYESGGRVGLGTLTPLDYNHVRFTDAVGALTGFAVQNLSGAAGAYSGMLFYDQNGALGQFQGFNNSTHEYRINNVATSGSINFMLGSTTRFKIASTGNVGISDDAPTHKLSVLHTGGTGIVSRSSSSFSVVDIDSQSGDAALRFYKDGAGMWNIRNRPADDFLEIFELGSGSRMAMENGTGRMILTGTGTTEQLTVGGNVRVGTGTNGCVMDNDGTVIAGACSSDLRFKKDVAPFGSIVDRLARLTPVHYHWRADEFKERRFGTAISYGLIAQDVQQVFPDLVKTDDQGYLTVNYSKLPLLTLQAVKDLKAENDNLKSQNEALEQRLSALESAIEALRKP